MSEPSRQVRALHFEWWRFAILAFLTLSIMGGVAIVGSQDGSRSTSIAMAVFGVSLVSFFAYRWHRLRTDAATGHLTPEEFFRDPRTRILGPMFPFGVWLVFTIVAVIAIGVSGAMGGG